MPKSKISNTKAIIRASQLSEAMQFLISSKKLASDNEFSSDGGQNEFFLNSCDETPAPDDNVGVNFVNVSINYDSKIKLWRSRKEYQQAGEEYNMERYYYSV